jgi:flagellar motor switch protein FliN/FliY
MSKQSNSPNEREALGLDTLEIDTIGEILNISMGAAATAISLMLSRQVVITTPTVRVIPPTEFEFARLEPAIGIEIQYVEGLHGSNVMIMSARDARSIVGLLLADSGGMPEDSPEMDELQTSALGEIMNQMMGASSTALATFLNRSINISPPTSFTIEESGERFAWMREQKFIVTVGFRFVVEDLLDSEFITVMPVEFTRDLVKNAMSMDEGEPEEPAAADAGGGGDDDGITGHQQVRKPVFEADYQEEPPRKRAPSRAPTPPPARPAPAHEAPPARPAPSYEAPPAPRSAPRRSVDVTPLQFGSLDGGGGDEQDQVNLDLVMDIDLNVVVEIGRVKKLVKEIVAFRQGSIVELDKQAGEPVDIMVNGKLIARGDVVVIDDNFGVRITEIVGSLGRP